MSKAEATAWVKSARDMCGPVEAKIAESWHKTGAEKAALARRYLQLVAYLQQAESALANAED